MESSTVMARNTLLWGTAVTSVGMVFNQTPHAGIWKRYFHWGTPPRAFFIFFLERWVYSKIIPCFSFSLLRAEFVPSSNEWATTAFSFFSKWCLVCNLDASFIQLNADKQVFYMNCTCTMAQLPSPPAIWHYSPESATSQLCNFL